MMTIICCFNGKGKLWKTLSLIERIAVIFLPKRGKLEKQAKARM